MSKLIVEVHTPYRHNRAYLAHLRENPPRSFLVPSAYQAAIVRRVVGSEMPLKVIPNPIADSFLGEVGQVLHPPPAPVLCWVGRLDYLKNWKLALEVAAWGDSCKALQ